MAKYQLIKKLKSAGLIHNNVTTLKSGVQSDIYFDFKGLISYPQIVSDIAYELSKLIKNRDVIIAGVPLGAIPYACAISQIAQLPMILIREHKKSHGLQKQIEGKILDKKIVLIEDVMTTGASIQEMITLLSDAHMEVEKILVILNRGGHHSIKIPIESLFLPEDFTQDIPQQYLLRNSHIDKLISIIEYKHSNIIVSLDLTNPNDIIDKLSIIGPHICAVKLHQFLINQELYNKIKFLSLQMNFLIIDDRKLADIAHICLKYCEKYAGIVDIFTVHGICGEKLVRILDESNNFGILLIHQLSTCTQFTECNAIDRVYSNKVRDYSCSRGSLHNLVGFISQEKISQEYLTFSPGINLEKSTDALDQTYKHPSANADVFIIGRGIYESKDILATTLQYKDACFPFWQH